MERLGLFHQSKGSSYDLYFLYNIFMLTFAPNKTKAAIRMVLSQDVGLFPIIHEKKTLGNHSRGIH